MHCISFCMINDKPGPTEVESLLDQLVDYASWKERDKRDKLQPLLRLLDSGAANEFSQSHYSLDSTSAQPLYSLLFAWYIHEQRKSLNMHDEPASFSASTTRKRGLLTDLRQCLLKLSALTSFSILTTSIVDICLYLSPPNAYVLENLKLLNGLLGLVSKQAKDFDCSGVIGALLALLGEKQGNDIVYLSSLSILHIISFVPESYYHQCFTLSLNYLSFYDSVDVSSFLKISKHSLLHCLATGSIIDRAVLVPYSSCIARFLSHKSTSIFADATCILSAMVFSLCSVDPTLGSFSDLFDTLLFELAKPSSTRLGLVSLASSDQIFYNAYNIISGSMYNRVAWPLLATHMAPASCRETPRPHTYSVPLSLVFILLILFRHYHHLAQYNKKVTACKLDQMDESFALKYLSAFLSIKSEDFRSVLLASLALLSLVDLQCFVAITKQFFEFLHVDLCRRDHLGVIYLDCLSKAGLFNISGLCKDSAYRLLNDAPIAEADLFLLTRIDSGIDSGRLVGLLGKPSLSSSYYRYLLALVSKNMRFMDFESRTRLAILLKEKVDQNSCCFFSALYSSSFCVCQLFSAESSSSELSGVVSSFESLERFYPLLSVYKPLSLNPDNSSYIDLLSVVESSSLAHCITTACPVDQLLCLSECFDRLVASFSAGHLFSLVTVLGNASIASTDASHVGVLEEIIDKLVLLCELKPEFSLPLFYLIVAKFGAVDFMLKDSSVLHHCFSFIEDNVTAADFQYLSQFAPRKEVAVVPSLRFVEELASTFDIQHLLSFQDISFYSFLFVLNRLLVLVPCDRWLVPNLLFLLYSKPALAAELSGSLSQLFTATHPGLMQLVDFVYRGKLQAEDSEHVIRNFPFVLALVLPWYFVDKSSYGDLEDYADYLLFRLLRPVVGDSKFNSLFVTEIDRIISSLVVLSVGSKYRPSYPLESIRSTLAHLAQIVGLVSANDNLSLLFTSSSNRSFAVLLGLCEDHPYFECSRKDSFHHLSELCPSMFRAHPLPKLVISSNLHLPLPFELSLSYDNSFASLLVSYLLRDFYGSLVLPNPDVLFVVNVFRVIHPILTDFISQHQVADRVRQYWSALMSFFKNKLTYADSVAKGNALVVGVQGAFEWSAGLPLFARLILALIERYPRIFNLDVYLPLFLYEFSGVLEPFGPSFPPSLFLFAVSQRVWCFKSNSTFESSGQNVLSILAGLEWLFQPLASILPSHQSFYFVQLDHEVVCVKEGEFRPDKPARPVSHLGCALNSSQNGRFFPQALHNCTCLQALQGIPELQLSRFVYSYDKEEILSSMHGSFQRKHIKLDKWMVDEYMAEFGTREEAHSFFLNLEEHRYKKSLLPLINLRGSSQFKNLSIDLSIAKALVRSNDSYALQFLRHSLNQPINTRPCLMLASRCHLTLAKWHARCSSLASSEIIANHFYPAVRCAEQAESPFAVSTALLRLAEFADSQFKQLEKCEIVQLTGSGNSCQNEVEQRQHSYARGLVEKILSSAEDLLLLAIENYAVFLARAPRFRDISSTKSAFRLVSLWFGYDQLPSVDAMVAKVAPSVPAEAWIPLAHQLAARLSKAPREPLVNIYSSLATKHPEHAVYPLGYVVAAEKNKRSRAAELLAGIRGRSSVASDMFFLADCAVELCRLDVGKASANSFVDIGSLRISRVRNSSAPVMTTADSKALVLSYRKEVRVMSGINKPKVATCLGSDGVEYQQLFKQSDDLRQDALVGVLFRLVEQLCSIPIRTYSIVPLQPLAGVIGWVDNAVPLGSWLVDAHSRLRPSDLTSSEARALMGSSADPLATFTSILPRISPVLRHFFFEEFTFETYFEARRSFCNSIASTSIAGYIVGLGDRHPHNILVCRTTGMVVHIDLNLIFEQGKLLRYPELVPFRLTRDIDDGVGEAFSSLFRITCVEVMNQFRNNHNSSLVESLCDIFRHDWLFRWKGRESTKKSDLKLAFETLRGVEFHQGLEDAERCIMRVLEKLQGREEGFALSAEAQVNCLIRQATDHRLLAAMFPGWQAWL